MTMRALEIRNVTITPDKGAPFLGVLLETRLRGTRTEGLVRHLSAARKFTDDWFPMHQIKPQ